MQRGNLDSTKLGLWEQQVWGSLGRFLFSSLLQPWPAGGTCPSNSVNPWPSRPSYWTVTISESHSSPSKHLGTGRGRISVGEHPSTLPWLKIPWARRGCIQPRAGHPCTWNSQHSSVSRSLPASSQRKQTSKCWPHEKAGVKIIQFNKYFRYMQITEIGTVEGRERKGRKWVLQRAWNPVRKWGVSGVLQRSVLVATAPSKPGTSGAQDSRREEGAWLWITEDPIRTNPLFIQHLWCHCVNIH